MTRKNEVFDIKERFVFHELRMFKSLLCEVHVKVLVLSLKELITITLLWRKSLLVVDFNILVKHLFT